MLTKFPILSQALIGSWILFNLSSLAYFTTTKYFKMASESEMRKTKKIRITGNQFPKIQLRWLLANFSMCNDVILVISCHPGKLSFLSTSFPQFKGHLFYIFSSQINPQPPFWCNFKNKHFFCKILHQISCFFSLLAFFTKNV